MPPNRFRTFVKPCCVRKALAEAERPPLLQCTITSSFFSLQVIELFGQGAEGNILAARNTAFFDFPDFAHVDNVGRFAGLLALVKFGRSDVGHDLSKIYLSIGRLLHH
jgi:hypothetical protein